ncbi:hypothetical protein LXL04_010638 [Taraxacum kok-saghyz]
MVASFKHQEEYEKTMIEDLDSSMALKSWSICFPFSSFIIIPEGVNTSLLKRSIKMINKVEEDPIQGFLDRSSINPLPPINRVFSLVAQEEKQKFISTDQQHSFSVAFVVKSNNNNNRSVNNNNNNQNKRFNNNN